MKICHLSYADQAGGAARAAFRLHRALCDAGCESTMSVAVQGSDDWRVRGPATAMQKARALAKRGLDRLPIRLQRTTNPTLHSSGWCTALPERSKDQAEADVLNLHWICGGALSVEAIGRLRKPCVWTLHDMWAFSGAEHYGGDSDEARWRAGYSRANRDPQHGGFDVDRWVWRRKQRAWTRRMEVVAPTRWLAACAADSALLRDWPIAVIPNALQTATYRPLDRAMARGLLRLPQSSRIVLFGAADGARNPLKGWDLLEPALHIVGARVGGVVGVVFGQGEPRTLPQLGMPLHWTGHLHDDLTLALLYSAADVMVVPSRIDNLPQTGTEAQACGCPVVAFRVAGLPDVVEDRETGYLAEPFSVEDLANGIVWVLEDAERHARLSANARARAERLWAPEVVVPQYLEVYRRAIETQGAQR